ncbi:phosphoribosyl-ATP diphosphatase [Candidatus Gottesmanbacteria bacterium RIFCSPLOWO2_01_FULL_39_12b]|uniref:Phosphoribosyl-ATP pyrophosphatase n=1 Tax=Candidatus Gottesmanbacteria bacterium RIFCSPLOWO2_01_FULL_39_12b TaxID=1798388 RepID=A0A1F6ARN7_9BACT|nr:MAG: phosphoribosyl-ATP diphosphatase [Candidatus Gottesmanbacteria bacterium RIFCSPLOWO2_01_FULL_39_12b]
MQLEELISIIKQRIKTLPKDSYVAKLYKEGENRILQKVGEEAVEVIVASKGKDKKHLQEEMADLLFMILVLMVIKDVSLEDILEVLKKRRKSRLE